MTHSERTIRIARVCKKYNTKSKKMGITRQKTKAQFRELEAFLERECALEELDFKGILKILYI